MASKVSIHAYNNEVQRWWCNPQQAERLGQRLMNAFSVGEPNAAVFYERDHDKASRMFYEAYVA